MKEALLFQIVAAATASMLCASAADVIGAVNVAGDFRLNGQPAVAHATLVSGVTVETEGGFGEIALAVAVHVVLAADSNARVYQDRLILQHGAVQLAGRYVIEADGKRISADRNGSISVTSTPKGIQVTAVYGRARIVDAAGNTSWVSAGKTSLFNGLTERADTAPQNRKAIAALGNAREGPSPSRPSQPTPVPFRPTRAPLRPFPPPLSP